MSRFIYLRPLRVLALFATLIGPVAMMATAAKASELPEAVKHILVQSVTEEGGAHFAATLKMAAQAVPEAKEEIYFLMVLYAPNRIGEAREVLGLDGPDTPRFADGSVASPIAADVKADREETDEQTKAEPEAETQKLVGFFSTRNLTGKIELGGAVNTGNTDDESLALALALNRKDGPWTYDFKSAFDIQRRDNETTQQRFVADAAVDYDITERLYTYGAAQYLDDEFSGFNYRITSGAGLGYRVFLRERLQWSVEAGPGVRIDSFEDSGNLRVTPAVRAFSDFEWDFSDFASFLHDIEAIQDGGLTVDTTAALVARITERVSGQLSYQLRYNSDAPVGNEEIDTTTRISLVYDF